MLEFSLSVLKVDVFTGLCFEGFAAEGDKSKIKTNENGLKEEEPLKRKKSWEWEKTQDQISKDVYALF